tara:strand:+ start:14233 stop:18267 length:4035 start_codon:yes stop_codon:yes gene_type:complete
MNLKLPYTPTISSFLLLLITLSHNAVGQNFERMETVSGFEFAQENNGVAVADYDKDNDLDVFVVAKAKDKNGDAISHSKLYRNNNNGTFTDVTSQSGIENVFYEFEPGDEFFGLDGFKFGAFWGDYDNDGYPDIFFTHTYKLQLFHNEGDGTFVEVTDNAGFQEPNNCRNTGATWFDYNNDGFLDIYVNDWDECDSNSLYRNNGNGIFINVTETTQIQQQNERASYTALPFDINNDSWMDLYVTNDFDQPNELFVNNSGATFSEQAQNFGLESTADDMGITIGDYNNDGFFDIFITAIDKNILYTNNGDNTFTDLASEKNVDNTGWAWGTRFADFDLDGDEDLFIVNGYDFEDRSTENNSYYKNLFVEGQDTFQEASSESNLGDLTISVEAVDFDYDNDGDIDLFVTNSNGPSYFYENKTLSFDQSSLLGYFKVSLEGTISNRDAIGTKLSLVTDMGTQIRYYSGVGFLSQSLQAVHFGLNETSEIIELEITWPSGLIESHQNLSRNTTIKAIEGQGFEVLNIEPSVKVYGCTDPQSCSYDPDATLNDGSCTYLPSNDLVGASTSSFFKTETYTHPVPNTSQNTWQVTNGEIINGQGSGSITVRWRLEEFGIVSVTETNAECSSLPVTHDVSLNSSEIPDNISVSRLWNEMLLEAIRNDFARPTVHARNLFHSSVAMYDAWAIYDTDARPYLIGNTVHGFNSELLEFIPTESIEESRKKAISYAMYVLLKHRFQNSPNVEKTFEKIDFLMEQLGYDTTYIPIEYRFGDAAALGNYIAQTIIEFGNTDNSREASNYDNAFYEPVNEPMAPANPGNAPLIDPNRWQPLILETFIDQSGNVIDGTTPEFLSPEWGSVLPFALNNEEQSTQIRDGNTYTLYHDPNGPPQLNTTTSNISSDAYKWGFSLVSAWGSHNDPTDGVFWDISPKSIGNLDINLLPNSFEEYPNFYNFEEGGDPSNGHDINPITNEPYETQIVPRGDYTRVLAEFWADGPDSETPPGHWFTILNYVNDNPLLEKKLAGEGEVLNDLEWDVKAYFILGGAMHDAAVTAWGIKGWYDYIRPISAIRYMTDLGQSTDQSLSNYHIGGIPLHPGFVEVVAEGDPLAGDLNEHVGKIKIYTWKGPEYIDDPETDQAGTDWILAQDWWPYQRPTFVTPPFAGYVSGHSTYSRAAAEVLTALTGDPFFPGGLGEFAAKRNEFLVFEEGPSVDVKLQWATYRDASDQCSLSRIWGGIHPPADDLPGRKIGEIIGKEAFSFGVPYFSGKNSGISYTQRYVFPNPTTNASITITNTDANETFELFDLIGRKINLIEKVYNEDTRVTVLKFPEGTAEGVYILKMDPDSKTIIFSN